MWGIVYNWRKIDCLQSKCRKAASARPSDSETSSDVINIRPKLFNSDKEDTQPHGSLEKQHTQGGRKMIGGLSLSLSLTVGELLMLGPRSAAGGEGAHPTSPMISSFLLNFPSLHNLLQDLRQRASWLQRAQTQHTRSKQVRESERGRRSGVQVCGATKCYNWRAATPGHRASVMCRLPTATRASGIF